MIQTARTRAGPARGSTARRWTCALAAMLWCLSGATGAQAPDSSASRGIVLEPARVPDPVTGGGTYRALLIGNERYQDREGRWPALRTPVTDARALAEVLRQGYGFGDVRVLENATRRDILLALNDLGRRVLPDDNVLIYYAGHGFLDADTGRGFWVPVDARGTDHTTFLRNSTIRDELSIVSARARHTLLISDSCFSGSLLRNSTRSMNRDVGTERYYRQVANRKSVQILSAGGIEYVDDNYRDSGHSPFTYFLLNSLRHNDQNLLAATELASEVTKQVANNAEQLPESGVLQGAGDELGEFIFLRIDVTVPGVAPDKVKVQVNVVPAEPEAAPPPETPAPAPSAPAHQVAPLPTL